MQPILQTAKDRLALRRRVRMPCQVIDEEGFTLLARECFDLSVRGMGVKAMVPAPIGTPLIVSFRVPGSSFHLDLEARVARIVWGRRREDRHPSLGIELLSLDALSRAVLTARLRGLPPPVPLRPVRVDYAASVAAIAADLRDARRAGEARCTLS